MKNSLKKLRGLGLVRHGDARDRRERRFQRSAAQVDELARASQDMEDMIDCYDSLFSSAAATTNSAYEFSESLKEMGACLLEKTALNDDEESGKVLLMVGKLQFELQKLLDNYRAHIVRTISVPSESLLSELRNVEEMKKQSDEKRSVYEYVLQKYREKGKHRSSKGENYSSQDVRAAHEDFDQEATMFVFRLKSLKQGQSRSLLTQAARHHAAQLSFFKKAFKILEAVEPHVKLVTEQQHIDYQFSGLEDDDSDSDDSDGDYDSDYKVQDDGELSFDYGKNNKVQNVVLTPRSSMEVDSVESVDLTSSQVTTVDAAKTKKARNTEWDSVSLHKGSTQSAPLFADKKFDPAERFRQLRPLSSHNYHSYVLPTPREIKGPDSQTPRTRYASLSGPLEQKKHETMARNVPSQPPVLKDSNNNIKSSIVSPPPLTGQSDGIKFKRHAFSGPLTGMSWPNQHGLSATTGHLRTQMPPPSSSLKLSPNVSAFVSSPKISELHELPRPPANNRAPKFASGPLNKIGYSGPLVSKRPETTGARRLSSSGASPLPTPPQTVPRSFSIPSRGQSGDISSVSTLKMVQEIASPPLTPILLLNVQHESTGS